MDIPDSEINPLSVVPSTPSETSETLLLSDIASSANCSRFGIGIHVLQEEQSRANLANLENEELERATESTDWSSDGTSLDESNLETSGGTHLSDYDAPQVMPVGLRPGECAEGQEEDGEEEETHSEESSEVSEHLENADRKGAQSSDYDSTHCVVMDIRDGSDGEEEKYEKGQQIKQKPLSGYEPRHIPVEMSPGDFVDGYGGGEALA